MAGLANAELFVEWKTGTPMCLADTTNSDFQGAGSSSAKGLVPDPGNSGTTNRYLNETGVWKQIQASEISGLFSGSPVAVPIINGYFAVSVSSSAATLFVLNVNGSVPTSANPVLLVFRNNTVGTGAYNVYTLDTSINGTIPSGATLGVTASQGFRVWVTAVTSATSVPILGVITCKSGINIYPLALFAESTVGSTLLTSGSDSSQILYTASVSVSNGLMNILGYMTWENGLVTPGEWSVAPTDVNQSRVGMNFPGQCINQFGNQVGTSLAILGQPTVPTDDTIPQATISETATLFSTSGIFYSRANLIEIQAQAILGINNSNNTGATSSGCAVLAVYQDSGANALAVSNSPRGGSLRTASGGDQISYMSPVPASIIFWITPGVNKNTSTTFTLRAGLGISAQVATASVAVMALNARISSATNTVAAGALFGGTYNSYLHIREFMV